MSERDKRAERRSSDNRAERVPMHEQGALAVENIDGYVLRWFNDTGDRINSALRAGWVPVAPSEVGAMERADAPSLKGQSCRTSVCNRSTGQLAYLLKIEKDYYDEIQAKKEKYNKSAQDQIFRQFEHEVGSESTYGKISTDN